MWTFVLAVTLSATPSPPAQTVRTADQFSCQVSRQWMIDMIPTIIQQRPDAEIDISPCKQEG